MDGYQELCNKMEKTKIIRQDDFCYNCEFVKSPFCCCYLYVDDRDIKIFNPITLKELKPSINNTNGYVRYKIPVNCGFVGRRDIYLHQVIAISKFGDFFMYNKDYQVDHIDNDRRNNNPDNIQILLRSDNARKRNIRKNVIIESDEIMTPFYPDTFNDIYISSDMKLYKPINKKEGMWKLIRARNDDCNIYVLTDKNKTLRTITLNKAIFEVDA